MSGCADIQDALLRGAPVDDAGARAHLASCEACRAVAASADSLRKAAKSGDVFGGDFEALLAGVQQRIEREDRSWRGYLKSRPTWLRIFLTALAVILVVGPVLAWMPRRDLHDYPRARMLLTVLAMTVTLGVTAIMALRPAHRPPLPRALLFAGTVTALIVLIIFSGMPLAHSGTTMSESAKLIPQALPCLYFGVLLGAPIYFIVRALDHEVTRLAALLAASTAGLTANLGLHLHCAQTGVDHLFLGHFSVAILFLLLAGAAGLISARVQK